MNILKFLKKYWPVIIIFVLSLTPLLWFKGNLIIAGGDESILLNPASMFKSVFYAWNPTYNGGSPVGDYQGNVAHLFPFVLFWVLGLKFSLSLVVIEKLWFVITWFFTGLGIYYLSHVLFKKRETANMVTLFSATLYLFNLFIMQYPLMYTMRLPVMIVPWTLALTIQGLQKHELKYAVYFALASLFGASGWVNPPSALIMVSVPFLYFIFYIIYYKNYKKSLIFFIWCIFFFILFNLYWLVPFITNLLRSAGSIKESGAADFFSTTSLFDPLRFLGAWAFREFSHKIEYFPLNKIYYNSIFTIIGSYFILVISLSGYIFTKKIKENKNLIFFFILAVLGLFLVKGPGAPLGQINTFFYKYFPGFWIFREPYAKFMPVMVFAISVMFGSSIVFILDFITSKLHLFKRNFVWILLSILLVGITIFVSYPLPAGESIWHYYDGPARPYYAQAPQYWVDAGNWLKENDPDSTVLTLPKNGSNSTTYNWDNGFTLKGSVASYFIPNPYFYYQHKPMYQQEETIKEIYDQVLIEKNVNLAKNLGFYGVKYLLTQRDIDWNYIVNENISNSQKVNSILEGKQGLKKTTTYDQLDLWQIDNDLVLPKVFTGNNPLYLSNKENIATQIPSIIELTSAQKNKNFIISKKDGNSNPDKANTMQSFSLYDSNVSFDDNRINIDFEISKYNKYYFAFNTTNVDNMGKIYLDNEELDQNQISNISSNENSWVIIELAKLSDGNHTLSIDSVIEKVDIKNHSFESITKLKLEQKSGDWELIDASTGNGGNFELEAYPNNDSSDGKKSIKISANGHTAGLRKKIKLEPDSDYHLTFNYKNYDAIPASYTVEFIDEENGESFAGPNENLDLKNEWGEYKVHFRAKTDSMYLYFYARGLNGQQTVAIDNIRLKKIKINPNSLVIKNNQNSSIDNTDFTKVNPTRYVANINTEESYYLNFLESYDPNWKVYLIDDNKLISNENYHYLLNGYGNSWKIEKTGKYQLVIKYQRQSTLTVLYLISIASILLSLLYIIIIRKKYEKKQPIK